MENTSGLYNPGFVGSQFHWWLGQIADSKTWRDNQPKSHFKDRKDIPGWGYRYKVRIMGIHDAGEAIIESEQLPWAQVMYPITAGGGQGGSLQTPALKQGCFVFGFFLDGSDEQVPIIMGVLGNNTKTIIGETSKEGGEDSTFGPKSGYDDESIVQDDQIATEEPSSSPTIESTDGANKDNAVDTSQEEENGKESPMECVKHGNSLTSMQTHMSNFQKKYQKLMSQLNSYGPAATAKTPINIPSVDPTQINSKIDDLIDETSNLSAMSLGPSLNNTQNFLSEKLNNATKSIDDATSIFDRLDNLEANVKAQGKLACVFNKIKGDLARLIAAAVRKSLAKKQNRTPQNNNQVRPTGNNSGLIPPLPPEGFYTPMNPCETEDIIADVFSNVMGEITTGYQSAITPLASGSGTPTQGRLADVLSQENVLTNLENGNLFGGLASALGAGIGINANQSGAITTALKAGNYAAALTSLVNFSGSNAALGGLSTAIQSIDNGDIVGAFQGIAGPLGIDSKLMGAVGASLGAITNGDIASLTNALGNLGGSAPQILTDVLGGRLPLSGIDIGGFGALGGLDFDLALASTFMSTAAAFLECDPRPKCPVEDTYNFGNGGSSKEESNEKVNSNNIVDKVTKAKENIVESNASGAEFDSNGRPLNEAARNLLFPDGSGEVTDVGQFSDTGVPLDDTARNFLFPGGTGGVTDVGQFSDTGVPLDDTARNLLFPGGTGGVSDFNTSDFLKDGELNLTPKNKFNVPKIKKVIEEEKIDSLGNSTTIEYEDTVVYPEGKSSFKGSETTSIEVENGQVIIKEKKNIQTRLQGKTYSTLFIDSPDGTRTINPNPQFFILGVEVTLEGWEAWRKLPFPEDVKRAEEFANRYRK